MLNFSLLMDQCLELAQLAKGRTSPNPMVGALVVSDDGRIIASGYHKAAGQAHAEVIALEQAGKLAKGQTLVLNLEPCCHWGRTPPCTEKIIASGIKRVVSGMSDPNPAVSGGGHKALLQAGIEVITGINEAQCRYLNQAFIKWIKTGRPWVCLKLACTLDGKIADRNFISRWITSAESRQYVHHLRNIFDAVLVGGHTAKLDNPELTVRDIPGARNPTRVVLDPLLALSPESKLCSAAATTIIFSSPEAIKKNTSIFAEHVHINPCQHVDNKLSLVEVLRCLGKLNILSVLCEGGGTLAGCLLEEHLVDEVRWLLAPKLLPDKCAIPATAGSVPMELSQSISLENVVIRQLGNDILVEALIAGAL